MQLQNILLKLVSKDSLIWRNLERIYSLSYLYNYFKYYRSKAATTREIYIEFVSYCNLRCKLCSLDHTKPKVRMAKETLEKLFDEIFIDRRFRKVKIIHLHNAGEVLLHPEFPEMILIMKRAKQRFQEAGYIFPKIAMLTNGCILKEQTAAFILDSGVFDFIRFSMDGGTPEKFEVMRERAKWKDFYTNVRTFLVLNKAHKQKINTGVITLVERDKKLDKSWMHHEFKELYSLIDNYELRYPHNWAGEVDLNDGKSLNKSYKIGCSMLMKQLVLLPNGDVTVCCSDLNSRGVIGNLLHKSLYDIYSDRKRISMIDRLYNGKKESIDMCKNCPTY